MAERDQNINIYAGETVTVTLTIVDKSTGAVVDLTGATISWVFRDATATALFTKTVGSGITVAAPTTGVCTLTLLANNSSSLSGDYRHECRPTLADGTVFTACVGNFNVKPTLTA